ncbi:MAG: transglycosylase SLT domain-containing protein [Bacteriovoracaceae bacterium]
MKGKMIIAFLLLLTFSTQVIPNSQVKERHVELVSSLITKLQTNVGVERANVISEAIIETSLKYKLDPRVLVAIIDTESDFRQGMISYTGDLSLVQINPSIWNREFARMKRELIDTKKLQNNEAYAIDKMGEILHILKTRYTADGQWFARYHSRTKKFKNLYHSKVESRLSLLAYL